MCCHANETQPTSLSRFKFNQSQHVQVEVETSILAFTLLTLLVPTVDARVADDEQGTALTAAGSE